MLRSLLLCLLIPYAAALGKTVPKLRLVSHLEPGKELLHFEFYNHKWPDIMILAQNKLPSFIRWLHPLAKAGIRTYSINRREIPTSFGMMWNEIGCIDPKKQTSESDCSVGLLVYMHVRPEFRGNGLGDTLLDQCLSSCKQRGDSHLLLVHDDQGSGRLVRYYEARGFRDVSNVVPRGMVRMI